MSTSAVIVVPCYNEARRLDTDRFQALAQESGGPSLLFVDDGSTDRTGDILRQLAGRAPESIHVLVLERNAGKAEAVRTGLLAAVELGTEVVGYLDADLSTPPSEVLRLLGVFRERRADVLIGSRVQLMGTEIRRRPLRHYLGRIFATVASLCLPVPVYDTQCGAKLFRVSPQLRAAITQRFDSRWAFDVELLQRLLESYLGPERLPAGALFEEPLRCWKDVGGSTLRAASMVKTGFELMRLLARTRRGSTPYAPAAERVEED